MFVQWQLALLIFILCMDSTESWFVQPVAHQRACSAITVMRQSSSATPALQRLWPFRSTAEPRDQPSTAHRSWLDANFDGKEHVSMLIISRDSSDAVPDSAELSGFVQPCPAFKRELTVSATQSDAWADELLQLLIANPEYSSQTSVDWLKRDITHTAREFEASLARRDSGAAKSEQRQQSYELIVKLEVIESKTLCPNFHVDKVDRRLICTYVGPDCDRNAVMNRLGNSAISKHTDTAIQQAEPCDILILKGGVNTGVVHRSPPLAAGSKRLILTIDEHVA
eukprot:3530-Heterococcus_DN1.PRE.6